MLRAGTLVCLLCLNAGWLNAQIHESPADTGRMQWGRKDFSTYVSARPCDRAVREVEFDLTRKYNRDTAFQLVVPNNPDPTTDPAIVAVATACGKRFTLENINPQELWSLVRISFAQNNDAQAMAAFERRYSLAESDTERSAVLLKGAIQIFREKPLRLPYVHDIIRRLDAIGEPARFNSIVVRMQLLGYWYDRYNIDSIQSYAWSIIRLAKTLPQADQDNIQLHTVWETLLVVTNANGAIPAQRTLLDSALSSVSEWNGGRGSQWLARANQVIDTRQALYGKKARPLAPKAWANDGGVARPAPGKLSLILRANHNCGAQCYDVYNISRQLIAQHGDDIDITYAVATVGYAPNSGPLAFADEVKAVEQYFVNYLKLPIALAIFETKMSKTEDGRIVREGSALDESFSQIDAIIIDKSGSVRWIGRLQSQQDKRMIDAAIANILTGASSAP